MAADLLGCLQPRTDDALDLFGVTVGQRRPLLDGCGRITLGKPYLALDDERTRMVGRAFTSQADLLERLFELPGLEAGQRQLAEGMGGDERRIETGFGRCGACQVDDPGPVVGALGDLQPLTRGRTGVVGALQAVEAVFGAIDQPGLQEVETQLVEGMGAGAFVEVGPVDQVLVDTDGPVGLTAPAKERAQREVQLAGFGIDPDDVDEGVDGVVVLLFSSRLTPRK